MGSQTVGHDLATKPSSAGEREIRKTLLYLKITKIMI